MSITLQGLQSGGGSSSPVVITPTLISSDENDYNPTGWSTATIVRLSGSNGIKGINGFAATTSGDQKKLINVGTWPIYFTGEHPNTTAANRIAIYRDVFLFPFQSRVITYDSTLGRWEIDNQDLDLGMMYGPMYRDSYGAPIAGGYGQFLITAAGGGSLTFAPSTTDLPNGISLGALSNGAAGSCVLIYPKSGGASVSTHSAFASAHIINRSLIYMPTISTAADPFFAELQITSYTGVVTRTNNNSIGVRYSDSINGGRWQGFSRDAAGVESTLDTGVTVANNTLYNIFYAINKSSSEIRFYINKSFKGLITGNMPDPVQVNSRAILTTPGGGAAAIVLKLNVINTETGAIYSQ